MDNSREYHCKPFSSLNMSRRECIRLLLGGWGILSTFSFPVSTKASEIKNGTIIDQFLGEELFYQIGFWFFAHCGEAKTGFSRTDSKGFYRLSLEGQTVGIYDLLLGRYRYSFISYAEHSTQDDRLRPVDFTMKKRHLGRESQRRIIFDYHRRNIVFSQTFTSGEIQEQVEPMKKEMIYEDYLTVFYNFRHGYYGTLCRGCTYRLPLCVRLGMKSIDLNVATVEQEQLQRSKESKLANKNFFLQFQVHREDVSSASGDVEGWLSSDAVPLKGTIKDVIFFGDLWGIIVRRRLNN